MTYEEWEQMTPGQREANRDESDLTPQLSGLEGWRVEVTVPTEDAGYRGERYRFIVGRSTGWRPCHLEIHNRRSLGGGPALKSYSTVRKIELVR